MKSTKKAAYFVLFTAVTLGPVAPIHAQQRRTNFPTPSYTPPPVLRPGPRPEPVQQPRYSQPENRMPEQRQRENTFNQAQQEEAPRRAIEKPESHRPENHPNDNFQPENRVNLGANHPNTSVLRPSVMSPAIRHAMTYNTRPGGVRIRPDYFAAHYGREHGFHFIRYAGGPCIGDCGLVVFGGEWYFNFGGGWFGIIGPLPPNWAFQTDYLYIDIGNDGNYYLYDASFPNVTVQLTFMQNIGDDQAGADDDEGN